MNKQPSNLFTTQRKKSMALTLARTSIMAALVCVATLLVQIYNPATRGYLNFGDIMIFVSALTFGPTVGGFAGGVGSALSDIIAGYGLFAPYTLIIKGVEGAIAGAISNRRQVWRDITSVVVAGTIMVLGYFLAEFYPLQYGWAALGEVPGNISQIVVGAAVGIPIALLLRKRLPDSWWK
jgi:uncharacterized membrane protein